MYLYEIVSDLELHKQGINIDKFVIHRSMKQARELVADSIKSSLVNVITCWGQNMLLIALINPLF